jgi:hypothetical protein
MAMFNISGVDITDQGEQEFNHHRPWSITAREQQPCPKGSRPLSPLAADEFGYLLLESPSPMGQSNATVD